MAGGSVRMRTFAGAAVAAAVLCGAAGCSLAGGSAPAAATAAASARPSAPSAYSPLAGPDEPASALPQECSQMLGTAQLQAVFGAGLPIGTDYGAYAALPSIGRTGRVACVFGVGLDSFGRQSTGSVEVSVATYTSAADAVARAADTVRSDAQAGATTAPASVGGHPATLVVEQGAAGASTSPAAPSASGAPSASATASAAAGATSAAPAASTAAGAPSAAAASPSPAVPDGETELVMADGNRTFVLQIPFAKLSSQQAMTALTRLALEVYQNTLPAAAASGTPGPSTR